MALQTILTKKALEKIKDDVDLNINLDRFLADDIPFEDKDLLVIPGIKKPERLLDRLDATTDGDFKSAVAIYGAYKNLTPLQAIEDTFWESLALTDLFPYMQQRWSLRSTQNLQAAIKNHFFVKSHGMIRQGIGGLWWLVYMTVDEDRPNPYELTEIIFKNYTLRFIRLGISPVLQHKEAAIGILQYLKDHENVIESMENVSNGLTSYFNKLGAVKQLTYLDRDFFYSEMEKHIDEFKACNTHAASDEERDDEM